MFKYSALALIGASSFAGAVTLSYSEDEGQTLVVENVSETALQTGSLFVGVYDGTPEMGLTFADVQNDFTTFAQLTTGGTDTPTRPSQFGVFATGDLDGDLAGFESMVLYMLIIDTDEIEDATQFAFLGSTIDAASWATPANEIALPVGQLSLNDVDNFFAGSAGDVTFEGFGDPVPSIQLVQVPEPSSLLLVGAGCVCFLATSP